jgi:hypothetical protein
MKGHEHEHKHEHEHEQERECKHGEHEHKCKNKHEYKHKHKHALCLLRHLRRDIAPLPIYETRVHNSSASSCAPTNAVIVFAVVLEERYSYLYRYLRRRYKIMPHLQVPLQIDAPSS